jgi:hypothetical protein
MTQFNVYLYREMRLRFAGIEADTPEDAAALARDKPTGDADDIEDCNGEDLAALIDVAGDEEFEQSVMIDFEGERIRKAAPALLAALENIIDYAENEAYSLETLKDSPEAEAQAERAWNAVEAAQAAIAQAKASGIAPADTHLNTLLARRHDIGVTWSVEDVREIRPDLTTEQAEQVLQAAQRQHDATIGINWDVLEGHADRLFGSAPATDETVEA